MPQKQLDLDSPRASETLNRLDNEDGGDVDGDDPEMLT